MSTDSSTIYDEYNGSDRDIANSLLSPYRKLLVSCGGSLQTRPGFLSHAQDAVRQATTIFEIVSQGVATPTRLSWQAEILAVRVFDRALALLSAVNQHMRSKHEILSPFTACIIVGSEMFSPVIQSIIKRSTSEGSSLWASGPLAEIIRSLASIDSAYDIGDVPDYGRQMLLGGIVSDNLDLLTDVQLAAGASPTVNLRLQRQWNDLGMRYTLEDRTKWMCGTLYTREKFLRVYNISENDLNHLTRSGAIIALHWWDGRELFPSIQMQDGKNPVVYPRLKELLDILDPSCKLWTLAMWLGEAEDDDAQPRASWLATADGFNKLKNQLASFDALREYPYPVLKSVPPEKISAAFRANIQSERSGASEFLELKLCSGNQSGIGNTAPLVGGAAPPAPLSRITRRGFGPLYFSTTTKSGEGGRYDLPATTSRGTCYFSDSTLGAIHEVFGRILILDVQDMASRTLWRATPINTIGPLADLVELAPALDLPTQTFTSMDRESTQSFAKELFDAGYCGIVHRLKTSEGPMGVALFGETGVSAAHDGWLLASALVAESEEFWTWIQNRTPQESMLFMQFPFECVLA